MLPPRIGNGTTTWLGSGPLVATRVAGGRRPLRASRGGIHAAGPLAPIPAGSQLQALGNQLGNLKASRTRADYKPQSLTSREARDAMAAARRLLHEGEKQRVTVLRDAGLRTAPQQGHLIATWQSAVRPITAFLRRADGLVFCWIGP